MFDRVNQQGIYWDKFWPLVDGCTPAGPECINCWRARYQHRFDGTRTKPEMENLTKWNGSFSGVIRPRMDLINLPLHAKKPRVWFVLNDLYHENVPADFIVNAYEVMSEAKQHIFIVCTKRPERIVPVLYGEEGRFYLGGGDYHSNIWHMTTAGNQEMADKRIPELLKLREASPGWPVLGASIEPMLGPIDLMTINGAIDEWWTDKHGHLIDIDRAKNGLNWIVLGGESGPGARPMHPGWARKVRDDCQAAGVSFLFKQMFIKRGYEKVPHKTRLLDGRTWNELPEASYGYLMNEAKEKWEVK